MESSILVWDLASQRPLKKLSGHENLISSIIDLRDSASIVTASFDCKVAIWDLSQNFNCIQLLEEPTSPLLCLDFNSEDDILCAGCLDGSIIVWQVFFQNGLYHGCAVKNRLAFSGHIIELSRSSSIPNTILVLESDFIVRLYSIETAQLLKSFQGSSPSWILSLLKDPRISRFCSVLIIKMKFINLMSGILMGLLRFLGMIKDLILKRK